MATSLSSFRSRWGAIIRLACSLEGGAITFLGVALVFDAILGDGALLGVLIRWPGGATISRFVEFPIAVLLLLRRRLPRTAACACLGMASIALLNAVEFWWLLGNARIRSSFPIPLSLLIVLFFSAGAWTCLALPSSRIGAWAGAVAVGPVLVLLHIAAFGSTDYRRPADAIVVFGAKPGSLALHDRVREGVRLWRENLAPRLILSGASDEVEDMIAVARKEGVHEAALVRDDSGLNTAATLRNLRVGRVLAVSHDFHLARIKLMASRMRIECATVPCSETRPLTLKGWFVLREGAAFPYYYLFRRG